MKKRRTLIISLLLVAALCLGIGYAALARELVISSTANLSPDDSDFNIVFVSATPSDTSVATASVTGTGTTANYTITGLSHVGDKVTLTFEIENKTTDVDASLVSVDSVAGELFIGEGTQTAGTVSDYFSKDIKITHEDNSVYAEGTDFVLAPGEKATVTIDIELLQTVTDKITLTGASVFLDFSGTN